MPKKIVLSTIKKSLEESPEVPKESKPRVPDAEEAKERCKLIRANAMKHAGVKGKNPFIWLNDNLVLLERALGLHPTQEVIDKIMALPEEPECNI